MYNKTKRQGGSVTIFIVIAVIGALMFMVSTTGLDNLQNKQIKALQNNDKCITEYVNKIQPNPNETEERSLLLKECVDN